MSKPEDIPQRVWDIAVALDRETISLLPDAVLVFARAIMAETEACAALVDCDCSMSCDLKEAAEKIRQRNAV